MRFLRAFEWRTRPHHAPADGVVPLVVVNMAEDDAERQAVEAAAALESRAPGERALLPFWLLAKQIRRRIPEMRERRDLDPVTIFENGIDVEPSIKWLTPLSRELRRRGVTLDLIAADVEDNVSVWVISEEWSAKGWQDALSRVYASPRAVARMPEDVRKLKPSDFDPWSAKGRRAAEVFNRYAKEIKYEAFRKIFIESGLFDNAWGRQPFRISNWQCARPAFRIEDDNGWEIPPVAIDTVSSPSPYLSETGAKCVSSPHERSWCKFVHVLNTVRACLATPGGEVIPWVSSPRFFVRDGVGEGHDERNVWLWREMMAHMVRGGVREFLFWNADPDMGLARRLMSETLRANDRPYSRRTLPRLELDVDAVTTRGYTTRYSDFLAAMSAMERRQSG